MNAIEELRKTASKKWLEISNGYNAKVHEAKTPEEKYKYRLHADYAWEMATAEDLTQPIELRKTARARAKAIDHCIWRMAEIFPRK